MPGIAPGCWRFVSKIPSPAGPLHLMRRRKHVKLRFCDIRDIRPWHAEAGRYVRTNLVKMHSDPSTIPTATPCENPFLPVSCQGKLALALLPALLLTPAAMATITVEGYYKLGEAGSVGTTNRRPKDDSPNARNFDNDSSGSSVGVTTGTTAAPGSTWCYSFSGTQGFRNGYWTWVDSALDKSIGFECWARASNLSQGEAFVFGYGAAGAQSRGVGIVYNSNGFQGMAAVQGGTKTWVGDAYKPSSTQEWVHLAITWDNSTGSRTARFYINGVQSGSTQAAINASGSTEVCLGAGWNGSTFSNYFNGAIDEARIFRFIPGQFNPGVDLLYWTGGATGVGANRYGFGHPRPFRATAATATFYQNSAEFRTYSGWDDLWARYAGLLPSGAGVTVAQVENNVPDKTRFSDKSITLDPSGALPNADGHASTVGKILYGTPYYEDWGTTVEYGFGRGISDIVAYNGQAFKENVMRVQFGNDTRLSGLPAWNLGIRDVLNISNGFGGGNEANAIRALDHLIDSSNVLACTAHSGNQLGAGVLTNEGLSGNLWNSIVVSQNLPFIQHWNGANYEKVGGNFRVKPDLVTADYIGGRNGGASSWGTPTVSSGAAFLIEAARKNGMPDATTNYVMKSILLAGASKQGLITPVWSGGTPGSGTITGTDLNTPYTYTTNPPAQPLDRMYGAGMFNINNAFTILTGGRQTAGVMTNKPIGWARGTNLTSAVAHDYGFTVTTPKPDFCAVLTWNRHITENGTSAYNSNVSNLKLELYNAAYEMLASSDDPGNNVEQIYLPGGLPVGSYHLKISSPSATAENYGLAWRTECPKATAPQIALQRQSGTTMRVAFQGVPKQPHSLFYSPNLQSGGWSFLSTLRPDNDGNVVVDDTGAAADKGFYRLYYTKP